MLLKKHWLLFGLLTAAAAQAQTELFNFPNFNVPPSLALQGSATFSGGRIRLTSSGAAKSGGVWFPTKRFVQEGFDTTFQFQLGNGGEGIAFVIQNNVLPALGRDGSGLGYDGVPNSLAVEFDTQPNGDILDLAGAHVSIQSRGSSANSSMRSASLGSVASPALNNGNIHTARVRYVPGTLEVFLDNLNTPTVSASLNLTNLFPLENGQAWFGFVAANGTGAAAQEILSWSFRLATTPFSVALTAPLDGGSFLSPAVIDLEAVTSGSNVVTKVEFFRDAQLLSAATNVPYRFRWDSIFPGAYTLTAVASDATGRRITSQPARVVIYPVDPVIGVNFVTAPDGNNFTLSASDLAGVIPQHYWNNATMLPNGNGSMANLQNAAGTITPVDVAYDFVARGEEPGLNVDLSADHKLMRAYGGNVSGTIQSNSLISFQSIPFPIYDVLVYSDGANGSADRIGEFRAPGNDVFLRDAAWTSFAGIYASAAGTNDAGAATAAGNYIRLAGLTSPNLLITNNARSASDGVPLGAINAVQIVSSVYDRNTPPFLTRGPYLQMGTPRSIMVRWRSNRPVTSRVDYGTNANDLNFSVSDSAELQEHGLVLTNLQPNTRYYYAVATTETNLIRNTNLFFWTSPLTNKPTRIWAIGDAGTVNLGNPGQAAARNAFDTVNSNRYVDVWLMLGDNAYNSGTDGEYQTAVFQMYTNTLPQTPVWPTIGNHETAQSHAQISTTPYLSIFNLPEHGEAGGLPSGTERYYSFDYGNIHFVCLDSMTNERTPDGPMAKWLRADLEANTNLWIIAFFHHPPYTKGSHNSDDNGVDFELVEMRENINPILESFGVDLVLSGHSHCYERSYPLKGHYGYSEDFNPSMVVTNSGGSETNGGPYQKISDGTVYIVDGSSGQATFVQPDWPHPVMYKSLLELGSLVIDIESNRLVAQFIRTNGIAEDTFTMIKQAPATPPRSPVIASLTDQPEIPRPDLKSLEIAELTLLPPANFLFQPMGESASVGADALFLGTAYGFEPVNYQWRKNGVPLAGQIRDALYLPNLQLSDAGDYDVIVTTSSGSITSQVAALVMDGTFTRVASGSLVNEGGNSTGSAWGDFDNDGDLDVVVIHGGTDFNSFFRNNGDGTFTKLNVSPITTDLAMAAGATWADYDNDGRLDLLVVNGNWVDLLAFNAQPTNAFLYHNNGDGTFSRVTTGIGADLGTAVTAAWADYDRDGWLDLATGPIGGPMFFAGGNVYHNIAGALIRNTNVVSGLGDYLLAQSASWADYNQDGDPDLFFADAAFSNAGIVGNETLLRNQGGSFTPAGGTLVTSGGSSTTASWADYDNDGDLDVFIGNIGGEVKFLFRNDVTNFTQVFGEISDEEGDTQASAWGDYDNDGWIDLLVVNAGGGNFLFHNNGDGTFEKVSVGSVTGDGANSISAAWVDIDNDGDLDLFVTNLGGDNALYRNNGNSNAWITINCAGSPSNRSAVGAKVRVLATIRGTNVWQFREIAARDSSGSPSSLRAEFGLGNATNVTTMRVEWPSGLVSELQNVRPKQFLTITEPPVITVLDAQTNEGDIGTHDLNFTVRLSAPSTNVVSVSFVTTNGTAIAGTNYVATNGTISIPPGQTNGTISVPIVGNLTDEPNRTFMLVLTGSTNMALYGRTAIGTIVDDEPLALFADTPTVIEGNSNVTQMVFNFGLNKPSDQLVTMDFTTGNGSAIGGVDFIPTNRSFIFNPGEVSKQIAVAIIGDTLSEANKTVVLDLTNIVLNGVAMPRLRRFGNIVDDDPLPLISVATAPVVEGNTGTTQMLFNVNLAGNSGRAVSFAYATANGSAVAPADYVARSGLVSLPVGVTSTNIAITINGDLLPEGNETFFLNLSSPSNAVFATNIVTGLIIDDDFRMAVPTATAGGINFLSVSNRLHRIERSFNLAPPVLWLPVPGAESLLGDGKLMQVIDPEATNAPQRFYRILLLP